MEKGNPKMSDKEHVMRWGVQIFPHAILIRIFGVLDQNVSQMFEEATGPAMKFKNRQVVIDFSEVEAVDSVGLVLCGYGLHHFQQLSIPVALVRPPASLLPVLKEHGLPEIPQVFQKQEFVTAPH